MFSSLNVITVIAYIYTVCYSKQNTTFQIPEAEEYSTTAGFAYE